MRNQPTTVERHSCSEREIAWVPKTSYRLIIDLPFLEIFNLDRVINRITAARFPYRCGRYCSNCEEHGLAIRGWDPITPNCADVLGARQVEYSYTCLRISKYVDLGHFQLWDDDFSRAQNFLEYADCLHAKYEQCLKWCQSRYILPEDLVWFCEREKIQLQFVSPTAAIAAPRLTSAAKIPVSITSLTGPSNNPADKSDTLLLPSQLLSANPATQPERELPQNIETPVGSQRFDRIAVEIDEIVREKPKMTPTQIMAHLAKRAGNDQSCVLLNNGESIVWENSAGKKQELTMRALNDRLRRWRQNRQSQAGN